jgi:hypothetical protein
VTKILDAVKKPCFPSIQSDRMHGITDA